MNDYRASLFKIPAKRLLNSKELEFIDSVIAEYPEAISADNIRVFADMVGNKGHTFCPATFMGKEKSKGTFEQQQLFPLYFEGREVSFAEIETRAESYGLPILFAYDTFSPGSRRRFTVVFLNDVSIPHLKVAEIMSEALLMIFPEADPFSKDVTEIYHGGNKLLLFDESVPRINICTLMMNMCLYLKDNL